MISYFPNATPEEQLNLWFNGTEEEYKLAAYLEVIYQEYYESGQEDESRYDVGFEDGYSAGNAVGYEEGYSDGLDHV